MRDEDYIYPVVVSRVGKSMAKITDWLYDNNITVMRKISENHILIESENQYVFYLNNESDALLFALRWGG